MIWLVTWLNGAVIYMMPSITALHQLRIPWGQTKTLAIGFCVEQRGRR